MEEIKQSEVPVNEQSEKRIRGSVRWFGGKSGTYGFITPETGQGDVFCHFSAIEGDEEFKSLREGQVVEFELESGPKGLYASSVRVL